MSAEYEYEYEYLELSEAGAVGVRDLEQLGGWQAHLVDGHVLIPVRRELVLLRHLHQRLALPAQRPAMTRSHSQAIQLKHFVKLLPNESSSAAA